MGTPPSAIVSAIALLASAPARAETCTGTSEAGPFARCFDPGNRLSITAGSDGLGGSLALRHIMHFDDEPDLVWKLDHTFVATTHGTFRDRFSFALYRGNFVRHARDGHIVIPVGEPKKVFLPFDIGAFAEAGTIEWREQPTTRFGIVHVAGLIDFARARDFRQRFAIGPVGRWDVDVMQDPRSVRAHFVAPFTAGFANVHLESGNGLWLGDLRVEGGAIWRSDEAWQPYLQAEATAERIVLAVNDRPISLVLGARYTTENNDASARIGARIVLFDRGDPRVSLTPQPAPVKRAPPAPTPAVDPWAGTVPDEPAPKTDEAPTPDEAPAPDEPPAQVDVAP